MLFAKITAVFLAFFQESPQYISLDNCVAKNYHMTSSSGPFTLEECILGHNTPSKLRTRKLESN